jgi:hypothetical protein
VKAVERKHDRSNRKLCRSAQRQPRPIMAPAASSACSRATTSFMGIEKDVIVAHFGSRQLPLKELDPQALTIARSAWHLPYRVVPPTAKRWSSFEGERR